VVPNVSSNSALGLGIAEIFFGVLEPNSLPQDIVQQDSDLSATQTFQAVVVNNVTNVTSVTFNGPANSSESGSVLATQTGFIVTNSFKDGFFNVSATDTFFDLDAGQTYFQVNGNQVIRGQIYPLLAATRRSIPTNIDTVDGSTVIPTGGLGTLRYANQQGTDRNPNSFVTFTATQASTGSNFTYLSVITVNSATNKRNFDIVRALQLELNLKISADATWFFEWFDSTLGEFLPAGTITTAAEWTPAYIYNADPATYQYANNRGKLALRVSVNSATATSLFVDLFGVRTWTPSSFTNQALKATFKLLNDYPGKFQNGTTINTSS